MRRYLIQLIALLVIAIGGSVLYWRVGNNGATPAARIGNAVVAPASAANPAQVAFGSASRAAAAQAPIAGWPGGSTPYLGRYRLTACSDPTLATTGELSVFLRAHVPHQPKPVLSGILTLKTATDTNVLYLTHFVHAGTKLWTTVNLGIYTGPTGGQFKVTAIKGDQLSAVLIGLDGTKTNLAFTRFSHNPHP